MCTLGIDEAAWQAFADERHRTGQPLFPEHRMQFLVPDEVLLRESTREAFIEAFAALEISFDERYQPVAFQANPADPNYFVAESSAPRTFGVTLRIDLGRKKRDMSR